MKLLVQLLLRLRKEYHNSPKRLYTFTLGASVISIILGVLADIFLPFGGFGNVVRSFLLVPTSLSIFSFFYGVSLFLYYAKRYGDPKWRPYRTRYSPAWRRRISAVVLAFAFVLVYASGFRVGYTFISSLFLVVVITLLAFTRTTIEEKEREAIGLPDVRDIAYEAKAKQYAKKKKKDKKKDENRDENDKD